jgi:acyl-CoA reductase-like NAD-dependent aldehyde dehydrogenase
VEKYPKGNFLGPTIIADMNTNMTAYKTEIFGPVLCVINVDTLDEAIQVIQMKPNLNFGRKNYFHANTNLDSFHLKNHFKNLDKSK